MIQLKLDQVKFQKLLISLAKSSPYSAPQPEIIFWQTHSLSPHSTIAGHPKHLDVGT